jgi:hypothetical protein
MRVSKFSFTTALIKIACAHNGSAPAGEAYNVSPKHLRTNDMADIPTDECLDCNTHIRDTALESTKKSKGKGKKGSSKGNKSGSPKGKGKGFGKGRSSSSNTGNLQDCGAKCSFDATKKFEQAQQNEVADPSGVAEAAYNECLQNCLKEDVLEGTIAWWL